MWRAGCWWHPGSTVDSADEVLEHILERLDLPVASVDEFTGDEVASWPEGLLELLCSSGLLWQISPSSTVECDGCEQGCFVPVEILREPSGRVVRYVLCEHREDIAMVPVDEARLRRWRADPGGWARFLAGALGARGAARELRASRLWYLGKAEVGGGQRDVFLARGLSWRDAEEQVWRVPQLGNARSPLVLVPRQVPPLGQLPPGGTVVPLVGLVHAGDAGIYVDAEAMACACAREAGGDIFRKEGAFWTIRYRGRTIHVRDQVGLRYIAYLLQHPGREIPVLELVPEWGVAAAGSDGMPVVDRETVAQLKEERERLKEEAEEAEAMGDIEAAARAKEKQQQIEDFLRSALGFGGRIRAAGGKLERARKKVYSAIKRALDAIAAEHPELHMHLKSSIKTGLTVSYWPDSETQWVV